MFVESLAMKLREYYAGEGIFVLSRHSPDHRREFGLNELLYDILVCKTDQVRSRSENGNLTYVTGAIWQVESEFARNRRQAIYDFNKLVLGSSQNKLFIGPIVSDEDVFLQTVGGPAKYCDSNTYIALVRHPSKWKLVPLDVHCWKFDNGWKPI
jgi:hypothetical protein